MDRDYRDELRVAVSTGDERAAAEIILAARDEGQDFSGGRWSNVLCYAAGSGRTAIVTRLVEAGADINAKNDDGGTPLLSAAYCNHPVTCALLLDRGADIEAKHLDDHRTPLHMAAIMGHAETCGLLLDRGADIEAKAHEGRTSLAEAAYEGHTGICAWLLDRGADIEAKDSNGWKPLHLAALSGHAETCALLLDRGANIEATEYYKDWTPLYYAVSKGHTETCASLLERGADPRRPDIDGDRPVDYAKVDGNEVIVALLTAKAQELDLRDRAAAKSARPAREAEAAL